MLVLVLVGACSLVAAVYYVVTGNWVAACFFLLLLSVIVVCVLLWVVGEHLSTVIEHIDALSARVTDITEAMFKVEVVAQENGTSWRLIRLTNFEVGNRVRMLGEECVVTEVRRDGAGPIYTVTFSGGRYRFARDSDLQEYFP
jgi:hypothetical protein